MLNHCRSHFRSSFPSYFSPLVHEVRLHWQDKGEVRANHILLMSMHLANPRNTSAPRACYSLKFHTARSTIGPYTGTVKLRHQACITRCRWLSLVPSPYHCGTSSCEEEGTPFHRAMATDCVVGVQCLNARRFSRSSCTSTSPGGVFTDALWHLFIAPGAKRLLTVHPCWYPLICSPSDRVEVRRTGTYD